MSLAHEHRLHAYEQHRALLLGVARRMLLDAGEAEDVVQESWLRLGGTSEPIESIPAWLTTTVTRICLDRLRARTRSTRHSASFAHEQSLAPGALPPDAEQLLADSVGVALMVVLDRLEPSQRVAFVLHDLFDLAFDDIARLLGRSSESTRQLASRARRRVRGASEESEPVIHRRRDLVDAFLSAARGGDLAGLIGMLAPDVVLEPDEVAAQMGRGDIVRGAEQVAAVFCGKASAGCTALIDGEVGILVVPNGELLLFIRIDFVGDRISYMRPVAAPESLRNAELALAGAPNSLAHPSRTSDDRRQPG